MMAPLSQANAMHRVTHFQDVTVEVAERGRHLRRPLSKDPEQYPSRDRSEYRLGAYFPSRYPRINSRLRSLEAHNQAITAPPPQALPVTESVALPPIRGKHHAPISTPVVRHSTDCI